MTGAWGDDMIDLDREDEAATPPPVTDESREAFERAYNGAWDQKDFDTFKNGMYFLPPDESLDDPREYAQEINQDWIAFRKGYEAALTQPPPPIVTVDAAKAALDDLHAMISDNSGKGFERAYALEKIQKLRTLLLDAAKERGV